MKTQRTEIENLTITARELAALLALSQRHVRRLSGSAIPKPDKGKWLLQEAVSAYVKHLRARADAPTLTAARRRRLEAQAAISELDLEERRGKLVDVQEMVLRLTPMLVAVRQRILASAMTVDEQGDLLDDLGTLLDHALTTPSAEFQADADREGAP